MSPAASICCQMAIDASFAAEMTPYGINKDFDHRQLTIVECSAPTCSADNLPTLPVCGLEGGANGWSLTAHPVALDLGNHTLSLVSAAPGQPQCSNGLSIVSFGVTTKPEIVCAPTGPQDTQCFFSHSPLTTTPTDLVGTPLGGSASIEPGTAQSSRSFQILELAAGKFLNSNLGNSSPDVALLATMSQVDVTPGACQGSAGRLSPRLPHTCSFTGRLSTSGTNTCHPPCPPRLSCECDGPGCCSCGRDPPMCRTGGPCDCETSKLWNFVSVMANRCGG